MLVRIFSSRLGLLGLSALGGVGALLVLSWWSGVINRAEYYAQDRMMRWTAHETDADLVLVGIDEKSLRLDTLDPEEIAGSRALQLMLAGFPWSREVYGLAAERLLAAGARVVILDIIFPSARAGDEILAAAIRGSGSRIVIGSTFGRPDSALQNGLGTYIPPPPLLAEAAPDRTGYVNLIPYSDGVARGFQPYSNVYAFNGGGFGDDPPLPALSVAASRALGYAPKVTDEPEVLRIRYLRGGSIPVYSLADIFVPHLWQRNLADGEKFRDKIVLIGGTAGILQDYQETPMGRMSGPEIQLNIISALKRQAWVSEAPMWTWRLSVLLTGLAVFAMAIRRRSVAAFIGSIVGLAVLWVALFVVTYEFGHLLLPVAHPISAILLCGLAVLATDVSLERKERSRLRGTLERYVSKDVVREIVENPTSYLHMLGGQRKDVTVLFCDLKGFTSAAESLDASFMVTLLNEYFGEMVKAIFAHRGEVNKFIGDAIMAIWGGVQASSPAEDARQAVAAALEMKYRRLALNTQRNLDGRPAWEAGIGITQGAVIFGNVGSHERMEPAVIGDSVNLASRIEGLTRSYGCDILIDERVATHVRETCPLLLVDIVRVKGRRAHDTLFHPYTQEDAAWSEAFTQARLSYLDRRFTEAAAQFGALIASGPAPGLAECYRRRCEAFVNNPPPADWDGIWDFLEK